MKTNHYLSGILQKLRSFIRPMFYNGRSGQAIEGQKTDKDLPWFT